MFGNTLWSDTFDRAFLRPRRAGFAPGSRDLVRSLERLLDAGSPWHTGAGEARTRLELHDRGEALELVVALPGVRQEELEATLEKDVLTVSAQRRVALPDGARVHRQERTSWQFRRSFALPVPVDAERTRATLVDGILRVVMPKSAAHRPRKITVTAAD